MMERLTYTVEEAAEVLGIGRDLAYRLAKAGGLPTLRLGKKYVIPREALERMMQVRPEDAK